MPLLDGGFCLFHRENGSLGAENGESTTRPQEGVVILERENKRYRLASGT